LSPDDRQAFLSGRCYARGGASRWADDILADGAFFGSHEDALAARLRAIAAGLVGALERHPEEPGLAA